MDTHAGSPSTETSDDVFMKAVSHLLLPQVSLKKIGLEHHFSVSASSCARACGAKVVDGHFANAVQFQQRILDHDRIVILAVHTSGIEMDSGEV